MGIIIELLVTALVMLLGSKFIPGIHTDSFGSALVAAIVLALVNSTLGFLLKILTFPLNILTLGIFSFLISAFMLFIVGRMLAGFHIDSYKSALLLSLALTLVKILFYKN